MATKMEKIYSACVKHGHWMGDAPASTPSWVTFGFVLRCERGCGTTRHLEIHPVTGVVTHSSYDRTPGYEKFLKEGHRKQSERLEDVVGRMEKRPKKDRRLKVVS